MCACVHVCVCVCARVCYGWHPFQPCHWSWSLCSAEWRSVMYSGGGVVALVGMYWIRVIYHIIMGLLGRGLGVGMNGCRSVYHCPLPSGVVLTQWGPGDITEERKESPKNPHYPRAWATWGLPRPALCASAQGASDLGPSLVRPPLPVLGLSWALCRLQKWAEQRWEMEPWTVRPLSQFSDTLTSQSVCDIW